MSRDLRDLPDLDWAELRGFARSVVEVEWLLVVLALLYAYLGDFEGRGPELYIAFVAGFAASILVLRYTPFVRRMPRVLIAVELSLMTVFVTLVSWQTGGMASPLVNLYLLPLVTSALVLGRPTTVALFIALVACLLMLMGAGDSAERADLAGLVTLLVPMALVAILTMLLAGNIRNTRERIRDMSQRDSLTRQYNMEAFSHRLRAEHERARQEGAPYAVIVVDVDDLKEVNEQFGHDAGDRAIVLVVETVLRCTRRADVLARLGGDKFVLLAPGTDRRTAQRIMLRIRNSVYATTFSAGRTMIRISVSLGAAVCPDDTDDYRQLVDLADQEMSRERAERERLEASRRPKSHPA